MASQSQNIEFYQGENATIQVTVAGEDITGWTLKAVVGSITKTSGAGITITDGVNGVFEIVLSDTDTDGLAAGTYDWAAKRIDEGSESVLSIGICSVLKSPVS